MENWQDEVEQRDLWLLNAEQLHIEGIMQEQICQQRTNTAEVGGV